MISSLACQNLSVAVRKSGKEKSSCDYLTRAIQSFVRLNAMVRNVLKVRDLKNSNFTVETGINHRKMREEKAFRKNSSSLIVSMICDIIGIGGN